MRMAALLLLAGSAVLTVYPYLFYPLLLRCLPRRPITPGPAVAPLSFSLLFCAYNEERVLPETIANLRTIKTAWPALEIFAYSDGSSDRTFELLTGAGDVLEAQAGHERIGKPAGMRKLVELAGTDIVIFMDANVLIDPATIRHFERYFRDPQIGAVAGTLRYVNGGDSATASIGALYWRLEETVKRLESETGSTMGADGSLFAMRREFYPQVRDDLQDDLLASMAVVFHGLRCVSAPDIFAYETTSVSTASEFHRRRRIACGAFSTHRHMWKRLRTLSAVDRFKYASHKLTRWFGAGFLALGLLAAGLLAFELDVGGAFVTVLAGAAVAAIVGHRLAIRPIARVTAIVAAMTGTFVGVLESLFGARYATWTPVDR